MVRMRPAALAAALMAALFLAVAAADAPHVLRGSVARGPVPVPSAEVAAVSPGVSPGVSPAPTRIPQPSARIGAGMAFDPARGATVPFGGSAAAGQLRDPRPVIGKAWP